MVDPELLAAWVESSCAAQGVPVRVTDPGVLADVGVLMGAAGGAGRQRSAVGGAAAS
ncbi:hypothetical protein [Prescottella equi]|uniref:hypothetical protein n=1 Tax=Rhodococcus hoagii TaxID=43767 RepID=UPI001EEBE7A2|nr:hypothetical protein [Prescottella equi]